VGDHRDARRDRIPDLGTASQLEVVPRKWEFEWKSGKWKRRGNWGKRHGYQVEVGAVIVERLVMIGNGLAVAAGCPMW
jgi:hypothetical protein